MDEDPDNGDERHADTDANDDTAKPDTSGDDEEKSFRERVEEIREKREQEGGEAPESPFGGGSGMGGGMGGNPFAQMMGGMMGGGPGGGGDEEVAREIRGLREDVRDATRQLQRIADALEAE